MAFDSLEDAANGLKAELRDSVVASAVLSGRRRMFVPSEIAEMTSWHIRCVLLDKVKSFGSGALESWRDHSQELLDKYDDATEGRFRAMKDRSKSVTVKPSQTKPRRLDESFGSPVDGTQVKDTKRIILSVTMTDLEGALSYSTDRNKQEHKAQFDALTSPDAQEKREIEIAARMQIYGDKPAFGPTLAAIGGLLEFSSDTNQAPEDVELLSAFWGKDDPQTDRSGSVLESAPDAQLGLVPPKDTMGSSPDQPDQSLGKLPPQQAFASPITLRLVTSPKDLSFDKLAEEVLRRTTFDGAQLSAPVHE